ncbi:MAG: hypothetical protein HY892_19075 [Deltaproteobacteria bacterium]|nr:hypothetical protein [Deltaproteobacteria bacterium]
MEKIDLLSQRQGLALVAVLLLLMVLTLAGSTVFLMTGTDLKISVNAQQNMSALYAAEAGVHSLLAHYRGTPEAFFLKKTGRQLNFPSTEPRAANWEEFRVWLSALRYDPADVPRYVELTVQSREPLSRAAARVKAVIAHNQLPRPFQPGLVTAGRLGVSGAAFLRTGVQANQGYTLAPALLEELGQNQYALGQSVDPAAPDYRPPVPVPFLSAGDLEYYRSLARTGNNLFLMGNQELNLAGNQQGRLIFVEGDVQVRGCDLTGVTLISTGVVTFSGNSRLNVQQQIDTAIITTRDIVMKNEGEAGGVFWSGGSFIPAGRGNLQGMIVSQGGIQADSSFRFQRVDRIQNPYLPPPSSGPRFVIKGWLQL